MLAHPILINRPIVVTPWGVKFCRPSEGVLDILPLPQKGPLAKEDGEPLIDRGSPRTLNYCWTGALGFQESSIECVHARF